VQAEVAPVLESADDLHDLLSSTIIHRPRGEWSELWNDLLAHGRGSLVHGPDGLLWTTAEARTDALAALAGEHVAVVRVARGHLELTGVTTVAGLSAITTLPADDLVVALAALEREGFAMQGQYRHASTTEWVARRLLARMHSYSRRARRQGFEALTAQDFMRFLLRWQHLTPESQLSGEAGLVAVLEQLQGFEAAASAWESELLSRRLRQYDPAWLDGLCHTGDVAWLRLTPRSADVAAATSPSSVTPAAVVLRGDLDWLLGAARCGDLASPSVGSATAEVLDVLERRGASFAYDLCTALRRTPAEVEQALWDGVARGLIMCDGFAAIRSRMRGNGGRSQRPWAWSRLRRGVSASAGAAGRWSHVPPLDSGLDRHDLAEAVAEQLLARWGVVFRDLAVHDGLHLPWREVQWALRRLEDRGLVRGGRFVTGFSGEQFALPEAVEQLARVRRLARNQERVAVNATDPLNLVGLIVPGERVPALRTRQIVYVDGLPCPIDGET
jgi:ATP-dependent Lhr-like helicase